MRGKRKPGKSLDERLRAVRESAESHRARPRPPRPDFRRRGHRGGPRAHPRPHAGSGGGRVSFDPTPRLPRTVVRPAGGNSPRRSGRDSDVPIVDPPALDGRPCRCAHAVEASLRRRGASSRPPAPSAWRGTARSVFEAPVAKPVATEPAVGRAGLRHAGGSGRLVRGRAGSGAARSDPGRPHPRKRSGRGRAPALGRLRR